MPDETKPVSAANAEKGEAAMLRGEERCGKCGMRLESSIHMTESPNTEIRTAAHAFIPCATGSEGACECPTRKALATALDTIQECYSALEHNARQEGRAYLPWEQYRDSAAPEMVELRAALSAPCPREGLRGELAGRPLTLPHDAALQILSDECGSLRAELSKAKEAAIAEYIDDHGMTCDCAELAKAEQERGNEWRARREAESSRDVALAVCESLRAELGEIWGTVCPDAGPQDYKAHR